MKVRWVVAVAALLVVGGCESRSERLWGEFEQVGDRLQLLRAMLESGEALDCGVAVDDAVVGAARLVAVADHEKFECREMLSWVRDCGEEAGRVLGGEVPLRFTRVGGESLAPARWTRVELELACIGEDLVDWMEYCPEETVWELELGMATAAWHGGCAASEGQG